MSSTIKQSNTSTAVAKGKGRKFVPKGKAKAPTPPPTDDDTTDESGSEDEAGVAEVPTEDEVSDTPSDVSVGSALWTETDADGQPVIRKKGQINEIEATKSTVAEVARITTLIGKDFKGIDSHTTPFNRREHKLARAIEIENYKGKDKKGRASRLNNFGSLDLGKNSFVAMKEAIKQPDGSDYHLNAFKEVIADWAWDMFNSACVLDYGQELDSEFFGKQFLGGYLTTKEGRDKLTQYQSIADDYESGKKRPKRKKVSKTDLETAVDSGVLSEADLLAMLAKVRGK